MSVRPSPSSSVHLHLHLHLHLPVTVLEKTNREKKIMSNAAQFLRHSRKLRNAQNVLQKEPTILVRWFSKETFASINRGDDILTSRQHGKFLGKNDRGSTGGSVHTFSCNTKNLHFSTISDTRLTGINAMSRSVYNTGLSCSKVSLKRGFSTDSGLPPHQEIGMPSLSPTMTEGNIARWLKKVGDKVAPGEVLCEIETDKATVEMECMEEGYLAKIIHADGAKEIKVGEPIAITVEDEDDIPKFKDYTASSSGSTDAAVKEPESTPPKREVAEPVSTPEPKASKVEEAPRSGDRVFASPLARKLAEDHNVPLSSITGTGPDGSIVKADIEEYLASGKQGVSAAAAAPKAQDKTAKLALDYTDLPLSQIRKVTASRLLLSKQTIPHYYLTVDTCVDKLMDLRNQLNSLQESAGGKRISVNDLVIKAAALALRKVPQCNSSWTNEYIRQFHNVNINVAVQTDNGLFVPVIKDADKKGLSKISEEVKHLATKARDNSLKPEDYEGGTFTVSNLGGPFGIKQFCAIINPPQAGILAVGSSEKRVVPGAGPDQFKFASFMPVTLSCDHRVIDGAIGAEWLKAFKGYIENPESMLL